MKWLVLDLVLLALVIAAISWFFPVANLIGL